MNYGRIINRSFEIAWQHKLLWVFGLFVGGGVGTDPEVMFGDSLKSRMPHWDAGAFSDSIEPLLGALTVGLVFYALLIGLVALVCHLISVSAMIDSVNRIQRGDGRWSFRQAFSIGVDFMFPMLGLTVMAILAVLAIIAAGVIAIVLAAQVGWPLAVLAGLVFLPIFFATIWFVSNMVNLSQRVMVVNRLRLGHALDVAYNLFRTRLLDNLLIFLIDIGFAIAFVIAGMVIWAVVAIPFAGLSLLIGTGWIGGIVAIVLIGIPVSIIVAGFTGTVVSNLYTLFYFELVEPKRATSGLSSGTSSSG